MYAYQAFTSEDLVRELFYCPGSLSSRFAEITKIYGYVQKEARISLLRKSVRIMRCEHLSSPGKADMFPKGKGACPNGGRPLHSMLCRSDKK